MSNKNEFQFKPITKGLGFHQEENKAIIKKVFDQDFLQSPPPQNKKKTLKRERVSLLHFTSRHLFKRRMLAFLIDITTITLFLMATLFLFAKIAFVSFALVLQRELALTFMLFMFYYLLYFSIFDTHRTLGKKIFFLQVKTLKEREVNYYATFNRSIISFFSLFLFFIPLYFSFHEMLSDTKIISTRKIK